MLPHSLACLSGFCDVILVDDQASDDDSRDIARRFPKVELMESDEPQVCERARWRLLDRARDYDGHNLLWFSDADELLSPELARRFLAARDEAMQPGTVVECRFFNLWNSPGQYRDDQSPYRPHWKAMAFVDDRQVDYDRGQELPLHVPRVPIESPKETIRTEDVPVLHLQWLIRNRNQWKQAWYRCREWLHGDKTAREINTLYSTTFDVPGAQTAPVPSSWVSDVTLPDPSVDDQPSWHQKEILGWLDEHGAEYFVSLR